jgi:hypothetical protein
MEGEMAMSDTLEDFVREAAGAADRMLDAHGEVTPFWLVDTPEGTAMVVTPVNAKTAEEAREIKENIAQEMRKFMREHGARRYVFVAESWSCSPVRRSSDLPDDEGTVFVTNVAGAPIQVLGRRGEKDRQLYVGGVNNAPYSEWSEKIKGAPEGVEVVTGAEAEQLLADVQAERSWDGVSGETHPRRREIVMFSAEDRAQALIGIRDIVRSEGGKPHLSELEIDKDNQPAGGLFTELLQERVVH